MLNVLILGKSSQLGRTIQLFEKQINNFNLQFFDVRGFDYKNFELLKKKLNNFNFDILINFIAFTKVDEAEKKIKESFAVNFLLPSNLLKYIKEENKYFIHFSTDYVFDGFKKKEYIETDTKKPLNIYGDHKSKAEKVILGSETKSIVIRTSGVYSKFGNNFVKTIIKKIKNNENLNVVDNQISSPTYSVDIIKMLINLINSKLFDNLKIPEIYHFTNDGKCSWHEIAVKISQYLNANVEINKINSSYLNLPARRPEFSKLNSNKIKKDLKIIIPEWTASLKEFIDS